MDIKDYNDKWEELKSRSLEEEELYWNQRAEGFNRAVIKESKEARTREVVEFLKNKGALAEDFTVLDIGSGPGAYSIAFSTLVKKIEAIDISPEMMAYARANIEKKRIKNVNLRLLSWEEVDIKDIGWAKKFDLVFASMSPGINNMETLLKMSEASRGYCFMSSFARRKDRLLDGIREYVYGEASNRNWDKKIYYAYNILWKLGYFPEIIYKDHNKTREYEFEDAVKIYSDHIQKPGEEDISDKVREYLRINFEDGRVVNKSEVKIAWIFWKAEQLI